MARSDDLSDRLAVELQRRRVEYQRLASANGGAQPPSLRALWGDVLVKLLALTGKLVGSAALLLAVGLGLVALGTVLGRLAWWVMRSVWGA